MSYAIYNVATGAVRLASTGPKPAQDTLGDGEAIFDGWADPKLHLVKNGERINLIEKGEALTSAVARRLDGVKMHASLAMRTAFASTALGAPHTYGNTETDQINRLTAALAGQCATVTCADASGNWQPRPHTADQLRQVIADGAAWVEACRAQRKGLEAKLAVAKTAEEAAALKWVRPE